jgi:hypothetical protein
MISSLFSAGRRWLAIVLCWCCWDKKLIGLFVWLDSRWGPKVSRSQMVIHSPQPTNGSPNSRWAPRTGSLYEDIPLFGTFDICVSSSSTSSSSLRSIISCVLLLLLYCVVHGSSSSRSRFNWLNRDYLFFGFWQKSHKSHTAGDRPCTRSLVYLTTDRRLVESWTGTVFFCFVFFRW